MKNIVKLISIRHLDTLYNYRVAWPSIQCYDFNDRIKTFHGDVSPLYGKNNLSIISRYYE